MKRKLLFTAIAIIVFATATMAQVPNYVPTNGLVGFWPFTGNANDISGNANNGTVNGAILTTDRFGNANSAYSFNGLAITNANASKITVSNINFNNYITSGFTLSYWFTREDSLNSSNRHFLFYQYNGINGLQIEYVLNTLRHSIRTSTANPPEINYNYTFSGIYNNWHHAIYVWSPPNLITYIDGVFVNSQSNTGITNLMSNSSLIFGGQGVSGSYSHSGKIDDIGIWNRVLTQQEITALYQGSNNINVPAYVPSNGLVGWWPFNGNANDESGNGNNGTVNGATLTADRFGVSNTAYSFNGTNNKITVADANSLDVTTTATFSLWAKINQMNFDAGGSDDYDARLIDKGSPGVNNGYLIDYNHRNTSSNPNYSNQCTTGSTRIRAGMGNSINLTSCYSGYLNWTHIVLTFNNGNINIFNNGILSGTFTSNNNSIATSNIPLVFGYQTSGTANTWLNGKLDDIGIWNRVLTQQEITALYQGCNGVLVSTQPNNQNVNLGSNAQFITTTSNLSATYQWQTDLGLGFQNISNAGQYNGANNDTLIVSNTQLSNNNQQFRCIVTDGGCIDTSTVATLTIANIGVNETNQNHFKVYPNPASSQINVEIIQSLIGSSFTITDQIGKTVLSGKLNAEKSTIEIGDLSGGIYLFSIGNNAKQTFKVIKK